MKYFVQTVDGKEYGPVDQEVLIQWAKAGRVTKDCEIRNELMRKGTSASLVPFLKPIISKQKSVVDQNRPATARIKQLFVSEEDNTRHQAHNLTKSGNMASGGSTDLRLGAWLTDTFLLGVLGAGLLWITSLFIRQNGNENLVFLIFTLVYLSSILMYYTISMGLTAQTVGHWIVGLMVVRTTGGPVLMGRAFSFSVFYLLFFWSTVLFTYCFPSKRALQDRFSGTRIVKIATN